MIKTQNLILLFIACTLGSSVAFAEGWIVTDRYETIENSEAKRSVITFVKGKTQMEYKPTQPPFGLVQTTRKVLNKKIYYITTWAKGAQTVVYRVFEPEGTGDAPLCEVTSFSESPNLRYQNEKLEIEEVTMNENGDIKTKWSECR